MRRTGGWELNGFHIKDIQLGRYIAFEVNHTDATSVELFQPRCFCGRLSKIMHWTC